MKRRRVFRFECETLLPEIVRLPVTWQTLDTVHLDGVWLSPVARVTAAPAWNPRREALQEAASRALCGLFPLRANTWRRGGAVNRVDQGAAAWTEATHARICDSSTGRGTEPCDRMASWKARTSNFGPSAASASRRRRMMVSSPSL